MKLRIIALVEASMAVALLTTTIEHPQGRTRSKPQELAAALAGNDVNCISCGQANWLAGRVERLMRAMTRGAAGRDQFITAVRELRCSGEACTRPLCRGCWTLDSVAAELVRLMTCQRSGCDSACRRIARASERIRQARQRGATEEAVQVIAREAMAKGEFAPFCACRQREVRQQLEALVRDLVLGVATAQSNSTTPSVALTRLPLPH